MFYIAFAAVDGVDLGGINIESDDVDAVARELQRDPPSLKLRRGKSGRPT
jgi:hypothetical protein